VCAAGRRWKRSRMALPSATLEKAARPADDWAVLAKDALIAALVASILALPFIGLETYDIGGGALGIRSHFDRVALAAALVFAGRFAMRLLAQRHSGGGLGASAPLARVSAWGSRHAAGVPGLGVAFAVPPPPLPFSPGYL